ncbi:hypothetical protein FLO80_20200 [Aquicoccus porphyridii]|uniref:DUF2946 domain-containing protein n=1 Tax=Aquicoccus porphyridii TaxID=1852029 RepID=A0A5A9YXZ9_9RHOB|nr:hypothetical protein [Aquicoccus porphyridii]KAA0909729.1 hypothetical protein FLO80_20200 [Aquicoccus porphyridii]RAI51996.1 hypothetical protein DOO74_20150 [Rhodobacteraceae bacterium AsT-22]
MRVLSFFVARGGLVAMLMIALAVLAAPAPGLACTLDAHSEIVVVADNHGVIAGHAAHDGAVNRSCHPDPTCSPAAILMTRPIFEAQGFQAARQRLAGTTIRGRNAPVDLPPPRTRAVSRPNSLNDTQT